MSNMLDDLNNLEVQVADLKTKLMMILAARLFGLNVVPCEFGNVRD